MRFVILIFIWIFSLVFATPMSWTLAPCLDFENAKNIQVLLWGIGRHCRGLASWSWFGYGPWSLIHWWSKFWLYLGFEGAKNIQVLQVLIWGIGRHCRFLTGVWQLDHDSDMVPSLWYTDDTNFGSILVLKVKRTSMSFRSWFGALKDAGGSWLGFGNFILI